MQYRIGWQPDGVQVALGFQELVHLRVEHQLKAMKVLRKKVGSHHSKMEAVAAQVSSVIGRAEKVVLFCHHIATAQELTVLLASVLPKVTATHLPAPSIWRRAWDKVLEPASEDPHEEELRHTFIEWLCADLIRTQTWGWLDAVSASASATHLANLLVKASARCEHGSETIAKAAQRLYHGLLQSKSSRAVMRAAVNRLELLPGANGTSRVLGVCNPSESEAEVSLFVHNQQAVRLSVGQRPGTPLQPRRVLRLPPSGGHRCA